MKTIGKQNIIQQFIFKSGYGPNSSDRNCIHFNETMWKDMTKKLTTF